MTSAGLQSAEHSAEARAAERLLAEKRPLVIAHRGYPAMAPENTLVSFDLALIAGADLVELDYHHAKDGTPVVIHDADLDRTTDAVARWGGAKIRVSSRTWEELRALDAGRWFDQKFSHVRLPTLSEALDFIQPRGVTLIERKAGDAATCVELLRRRDLINRVVVQAFDWEYLRDFHQLEPRQILGALGPPSQYQGKKTGEDEKRLAPHWIDEAQETGARIVVWNKQVTREPLEYAHRKGLKVWVYTINDEMTAKTLLDLGVDGIITDNPALVWRTLALRP